MAAMKNEEIKTAFEENANEIMVTHSRGKLRKGK